MMHILLKIKEHLFHMGAHLFASSVSLLDCLVAAGLAKISEKNLFVFIAEDFLCLLYCACGQHHESQSNRNVRQQKRPTFGCKHARLWPRVCVSLPLALCVCVGEAAKKAEPRSPIFLCQPDRSFNGSGLLPVSAPVS